MSSGTVIVQELAARLGLEVDEEVFSKTEAVLHGIAGGLLGLGAALGAYAAGMQTLMRGTADAASAARKAAQQTGTTTDAIQELHFAAEASGLSAEGLDGALQKLSRTAYEASHGGSEAQQTFRQLGVSVYDAAGKMKTPDTLLQDMAATFAAMPDGINKTALAQKAFGRAGAELLPFLNKGGDGIEALREEAHEYGVVLDQETIAKAREFKRANHELEASLEGLRNEIGGPLLEGAGDLAKAMGEFVRENRKAIAATIRRPYELMRDAVRWLAKNLWAAKLALTVFASYLLVSYAPAIAAAVTATTAWAASLTAAGIAATLAGLAASAGAVMATAAWVAAVAALALLAEDFYTFMTGGDSAIGDAIDSWDDFYKHLSDDPSFLENHPVLAFLATMLDTVLHLNRALPEFEKWIWKIGDDFGAWLKSGVTDMMAKLGGAVFGVSSDRDGDRLEAAQYAPQLMKGGSTAVADYFRQVTAQGALPADVLAGLANGGVPQSTLSGLGQPTVQGGGGGRSSLSVGQINVQPPPGGSPAEYSQAMQQGLDDWWNNTLQQSVPGVQADR